MPILPNAPKTMKIRRGNAHSAYICYDLVLQTLLLRTINFLIFYFSKIPQRMQDPIDS
jgi:hypothetical protein